MHKLLEFCFPDKHTEKLLGVDNMIQIDMLDFGGQLVYSITHQTYLSKKGVYLLAFKLSMTVENLVEDEDMRKAATGKICLV